MQLKKMRTNLISTKVLRVLKVLAVFSSRIRMSSKDLLTQRIQNRMKIPNHQKNQIIMVHLVVSLCDDFICHLLEAYLLKKDIFFPLISDFYNHLVYTNQMLENLILNNRFESAKKYWERSSRNFVEELMYLFEKGQREKFLDLFCLLRKQEKLQFYLRVYFLIFNIHPAIRSIQKQIPQEQIQCFKQYLDNKGAQLAKTNEFLEFYALPFIKKPLEHLAFKTIFKREWVQNLKDKLKLFLHNEQKRIKSEKVSERNIQTHPESTDRVRQMENINRILMEEVKEFTEKYKQLEQNHKSLIEGFNTHMLQSQSKWFQITKQLVNCSKILINWLVKENNQFTNDRKFIKIRKKIQKYDRFVQRTFDDLISQSQDISVFEKQSLTQLSYTITQKNITTNLNIDQYIPTDYKKMEQVFERKDLNQKVKIINGLFWRIVKCREPKIRRLNILGIINHDLLGTNNGEIIEMLANRHLMKPTLRLLYAITLDKYGRKALFSRDNMYRDIIALVSSNLDENCLKYVIIIIEYLSSETYFKEDLIKHDIIATFVDLLRKQHIEKNQVIVQNLVATLLNLTDRESGLNKYEEQSDIFTLLKKFLISSYTITKIITYGIIYALLENEKLFYYAHQQQMEEFIKYLEEKDPNANKKQLVFIRKKLSKFEPRNQNNRGEENQQKSNQNEQIDQYEIQEESIEECSRQHEELVKKYGLKGKEAKKQIVEINQLYADSLKYKFVKVSPEKPITTREQERRRTQYEKNQLKQRNVRSPQSSKRSREEVLKQLNDQLKAQEKNKQSSKKRKTEHLVGNDHQYHSQIRGERGGEDIKAFESRPKIRRTPPKDDDEFM